jgi:hypothetical protein
VFALVPDHIEQPHALVPDHIEQPHAMVPDHIEQPHAQHQRAAKPASSQPTIIIEVRSRSLKPGPFFEADR